VREKWSRKKKEGAEHFIKKSEYPHPNGLLRKRDWSTLLGVVLEKNGGGRERVQQGKRGKSDSEEMTEEVGNREENEKGRSRKKGQTSVPLLRSASAKPTEKNLDN